MPAPTAHANHVLLAIPNHRLQGLRVGDIATDVLQTIKTAWVDGFGPFCPGSGREKDAVAITKELEARYAKEAKECFFFMPVFSEIIGESQRCRTCGKLEQEHQ